MNFKTESRFTTIAYRLVTASLFLVGCFFTIRSLQPDVPSAMASASAEIQGSSSLGAMDAGRTRSGSESTVELVTTNIEDIRLGQRVVGTNPLREQTQPASDINPATWRAVELVMHEAGIQYDLAFLRPLSWIETTGAVEGGTIHLELDEMGLNGPAQVTAINPCPEIEADDGTGRNVVTGTMAHPGANILYLDITGLDEPLGVTDTHPIWSESRQNFVKAGQLELGEQFRTLIGESATLTKINPHRGPPEMVFNLEVDGQHVYRVGVEGLLVHNDCSFVDQMSPEEAARYRKYWQGDMPAQITPGITNRARQQLASNGRYSYDAVGHYDEFGRLVGRTDFSVHPSTGLVHPNPHYHLRKGIKGVRFLSNGRTRTCIGENKDMHCNFEASKGSGFFVLVIFRIFGETDLWSASGTRGGFQIEASGDGLAPRFVTHGFAALSRKSNCVEFLFGETFVDASRPSRKSRQSDQTGPSKGFNCRTCLPLSSAGWLCLNLTN